MVSVGLSRGKVGVEMLRGGCEFFVVVVPKVKKSVKRPCVKNKIILLFKT